MAELMKQLESFQDKMGTLSSVLQIKMVKI